MYSAVTFSAHVNYSDPNITKLIQQKPGAQDFFYIPLKQGLTNGTHVRFEVVSLQIEFLSWENGRVTCSLCYIDLILNTLFFSLKYSKLLSVSNLLIQLNLSLQAEAQEAFLQDMINLCKIAETMCKAQEERLKQSFIDLPVWETPRSLMASLSEVEDG